MNTKHLFFDLDRTLWDFEKNSEIALKKLFDTLELHHSIPHFSHFFDHYKLTNARLWKEYGKGIVSKEHLRNERFKATLEKFKIKNAQLVEKLSDGYVELSPQQTALYPYAIETLKTLQKEGFQMHIITNGFKEVQFIKLEKSGLESYFDVVVCSEDVGKNKPSPEIFQYAMHKANAQASNSVMIGDDFEVDIIGALNVGMKAIHFDAENLKQNRDDEFRITNLNELPALLPWVFRSNL